MRETNNRRYVDSGVKCGMCDFGDGGVVVILFFILMAIVAIALIDACNNFPFR